MASDKEKAEIKRIIERIKKNVLDPVEKKQNTKQKEKTQ